MYIEKGEAIDKIVSKIDDLNYELNTTTQTGQRILIDAKLKTAREILDLVNNMEEKHVLSNT